MSVEAQWYWSQRGTTMGPLALEALQQLVAAGSIDRQTWIYEPSRAAWVEAGSVPELFSPAPAFSVPQPPPDASSVPPPPPSPSPAPAPTAAFVMDPKLATVICRASVLALPLANVLSFAAVGVVWALGSNDATIVREARQSMNCLLTITLAFVVSVVVGFALTIILIGPVLAAAAALALAAYAIIVGTMGLVAAGRGESYRYPLTIEFIR